jgi:hypothetical protein
MEDDPKTLALLLAGKPKKGEEKEAEADEGEGPSGAEAFASAVKLAMKGDSAAAFDALKVAVSACQGEEY